MGSDAKSRIVYGQAKHCLIVYGQQELAVKQRNNDVQILFIRGKPTFFRRNVAAIAGHPIGAGRWIDFAWNRSFP